MSQLEIGRSVLRASGSMSSDSCAGLCSESLKLSLQNYKESGLVDELPEHERSLYEWLKNKFEASRTAEEIEKEENERDEAWMAEHPVNDCDTEVEQDSPEICAERVTVCERLLNRFEQRYDLEALRAITQFSSKEERESSIRQPALQALTPMFQTIRHLRKQEAVERGALKDLQARYTTISNAVGNVTEDPNGKIFDIVVHDRTIWP